MTNAIKHFDALERWADVADNLSARLVRMTALESGNRYTARPIALDDSGNTELAGDETFTAVNLAEPAGADGQVPAGTDALAIDAGGQWVVFIRQAGSAMFPARIVESLGGALYSVREQQANGPAGFSDAPRAADLPACNLAELSLGPGAAVDEGIIVLVTTLRDSATPATLRYVFDHPAYAKYLD